MDLPLWKFVTNGQNDKTSLCELYHYYNAKIVHRRSVTYKGVETIWRHFLKWDSDNKELIYYDGRDNKDKKDSESFKDIVTMDKCILNNNKLYINIQPRDMLIWTWCLDLDTDNIELRQWERKLCKFCDPNIRVQRNGCYDFRHVEEKHKEACPYKNNLPKMGLQDKYYYVKRSLEETIISLPNDLRLYKKDVFVWDDPWGLKLSGKQELTDARKYINNRVTEESYSRFHTKSDEDKTKQSIREAINKGTIDDVSKILDQITEFKEPWVEKFISKYLYTTYKTVKEYPHVELIKRLNIGTEIWNYFKEDLFHSEITEDMLSTLKYKCCLIAILYKENAIDKNNVRETLAMVETLQQASAVIYFFNWDSKYGLFVGLVHSNTSEFMGTINKLQEMYETLPTKVQFTIDDIVEYYN